MKRFNIIKVIVMVILLLNLMVGIAMFIVESLIGGWVFLFISIFWGWLFYFLDKESIYLYFQHKRDIKEQELNNKLLVENYNEQTIDWDIVIDNPIIKFDEDNRVVSFNFQFYHFSDIISCELIKDNSVITTTKENKHVSISKMLIGNLLVGVPGALIGGLSGKSNSISQSIDICNNLKIKVTINDLKHPIEYINFISQSVYINSDKYRENVEKVDKAMSFFQVMINKYNNKKDL